MKTHITHAILHDKLDLFTFAGYEAQSGWDYAIPQQIFDLLLSWGIDNPVSYFAMDCKSNPWALHHTGEALMNILTSRSRANDEIVNACFRMSYQDETPKQEKKLYEFIVSFPDNRLCDEADAGFLDYNIIIAAFNQGWVDGREALVNENEQLKTKIAKAIELLETDGVHWTAVKDALK